MELVVARHREDLSWLDSVPDSVDSIVVYNKGNEPARCALSQVLGARQRRLRSASSAVVDARRKSAAVATTAAAIAAALGPAAAARTRVVDLPNVGRESDTYLHHILSRGRDQGQGQGMADVTIFCQGDPFDHSPDFLELLRHVPAFRRPVQPLSDRWHVWRGSGDDGESQGVEANFRVHDLPPAGVLERFPGGRLAGLRVCVQPISTATLDMLRCHDRGAWKWREGCQRLFGLREGDNIVDAGLRAAGFDPPGSSPTTTVAYMCIGATFAVHRSAVERHPVEAYARMRALVAEDPVVGYFMERSWLTLFGFQPQGDERVQLTLRVKTTSTKSRQVSR